jgi:hypothetical protein
MTIGTQWLAGCVDNKVLLDVSLKTKNFNVPAEGLTPAAQSVDNYSID